MTGFIYAMGADPLREVKIGWSADGRLWGQA